MLNRWTPVLLVLLLLCLNNCGSVHYSGVGLTSDGRSVVYEPGSDEHRERILSLKKDLEALGPNVREADALLVADTAIRAAMLLANEYRLVSPPLWHNHLVNQGKRERGLCFHWRKDLMRYLAGLDQTSFDFHWGVAHLETRWRYHSSVIVTSRGQPFEEGIVLDGWRDSGILFWSKVKKDKYPWRPDPQKHPAGGSLKQAQ